MVDDGGVGEGSMVSIDMDAAMDVYGPYTAILSSPLFWCIGVSNYI
jgi:hypothetical protein